MQIEFEICYITFSMEFVKFRCMIFHTLGLKIYVLESQLLCNTLPLYYISCLGPGYFNVRPAVLVYKSSMNMIFHSFETEHEVVYQLDFVWDVFCLFLYLNCHTLAFAYRACDL